MIFDKDVNTTQLRKEFSLQEMISEKLYIYMENNEVAPLPFTTYKN